VIRSLPGLLAAVLAGAITAATTTSSPVEDPAPIIGRRVEVVSESGSLLRIGDDYFEGPLVITSSSDGVTVVETLSTEDYLLGIREVPFSWPMEALKAQAVAARTYLAFTLAGGRTTLGRQHGYDICATTACQVYAGRAGLATTDGRRWQQAVSDTAGEILLYQGQPAQAFYSSTSGPRTRESEDIFPVDVPYLVAVDSPVESSPFVDWSFSVTPGDTAPYGP
jgi:stage II sporulation protein D